MGLDDLDFDEIDFDCAGVLSADANPLLDDFSGYIELNPAFEPWRMDDPGTRDQRVVDDWCAIFYRNIKEQIPNEEREVERQLEIFRIAIRAKIDQLIGNHVWAERGGTTEQQFREVPRTFPKTVQEVLTHPTERMVFQREELMSKEDLQAAISSVIIDPRRITNTLLTNLGLEEFIPPKRTKREKQ
ncbi:MAG: hypothetical protein O3B47_04140, partial [bacterium]|nr:hypothetical protein [bacterium]